MKNLRRTMTVLGLIGLLTVTFVGCELLGFTDRIEGEWQLVSTDGVAPALVTKIVFTESLYTGSTAGVETHTGSWTKSGGTYTLTGTFFGFASSGSITPTFSDWNNTLNYTSDSGVEYVYNKTS